jgi:hypothetical protein
MQTSLQARSGSVSKKSFRAGWVITALVVLFMLFDGVVHMMMIPAVVESFKQMGYPLGAIVPIAIIELLAVVLYAMPRTSALGAIILTGYLGGAVDSNVRAGLPLFSFVLAPVYVGILLWLGLYLRSARMRAIVPVDDSR